MHFGIWQIIYIALCCISLGVSLAKHGEYKAASKYNFFYTLIAWIIDIVILSFGGFFS